MKKLFLVLLMLSSNFVLAQSLTYRLDVRVQAPESSPWSEAQSLWLQNKVKDQVLLSMLPKGDVDSAPNVDDGSVDVILKFTIIPLVRNGTVEGYSFLQITLSMIQNRLLALYAGMSTGRLADLRKMNLNGSDLGHSIAVCRADELETFIARNMQVLQDEDLLFARREMKMQQSLLKRP